MLDFFRDLLIGESQPSAYVWAAVLLAHALIGVALMIPASIAALALFGDAAAGIILVASGYAVWEVVQFAAGGVGVADCVLDWWAVSLGAAIAFTLYGRRLRSAATAVCLLFATAFAGVWKRQRER